jgi:hypothetical protein
MGSGNDMFSKQLKKFHTFQSKQKRKYQKVDYDEKPSPNHAEEEKD